MLEVIEIYYCSYQAILSKIWEQGHICFMTADTEAERQLLVLVCGLWLTSLYITKDRLLNSVIQVTKHGSVVYSQWESLSLS
jgi:hypothetical protein